MTQKKYFHEKLAYFLVSINKFGQFQQPLNSLPPNQTSLDDAPSDYC